MNSDLFVKRVRIAVYESSVRGCLSLLERPRGRQPSTSSVGLSQWFNRLSADDKEHVRAIVRLGVRSGVFEMLTVLDGLSSIWEAGEERGTLELRCVTGDKSVLLNGPTGEFLHDIFAAEVPPE